MPGLPLAETDEADLGARPGGPRRAGADADPRRRSSTRFKNPDRKARFAFVHAGALARRGRARAVLRQPARTSTNRRREAWVLEAARYLHHPLRAAASKKLVRPALELVREIQQTGDIFFPKRWADATLSGYQSSQTAADVRAFIEALPPDYPPRLRWVLLSSADQLFRAAKLLNK